MWQAIQVSTDPEKFFEQRRLKHGDPFCIELPGTGPIYLSGSPQGAEQIFSAPPDTFEPVTPNPVEPLLGPGSLILLGGKRHKRERKLLTPPFRGERMRAYGQLMVEIVKEETAGLKPGDSLNVQHFAQRTTLRVIIQAIFGIDSSDKQRAFIDAIEKTTETYTAPLALIPILRKPWGGLSPWGAFARAHEAFDSLLQATIEERRLSGAENKEDILSLLLGLQYDDGTKLSDSELKDELRTMLVAGHETAATGLAWALGYIHRSSRIETSLRQELSGTAIEPGALSQMSYLSATCHEALRRHPVVPVVLRRCTQPFEFLGRTIPKGDSVGVALTLLHTDPDVWTNPLEFFPEHFLEKKYSPFQYAPFGGGARRCLGAAFATFEMKIVLGTLLSLIQLEQASGPLPKPITRSITMNPAKPIVLRVEACHTT